jgi:hypothetical protein
MALVMLNDIKCSRSTTLHRSPLEAISPCGGENSGVLIFDIVLLSTVWPGPCYMKMRTTFLCLFTRSDTADVLVTSSKGLTGSEGEAAKDGDYRQNAFCGSYYTT